MRTSRHPAFGHPSPVEPEIRQIVILHDVLFGFQALFAGAFSLRFPARGLEIREMPRALYFKVSVPAGD